ncbi:MAG: helix-turn-helix domain-containing protein [Eubacteriales bacterium]|nr:helix-turn-helix domain-containing protein [Eubacteriales bacterium]
MKLWATVTQNNTRPFPLHSHTDFEILYYTQGTGVLRTAQGNIPFFPGCILVVPPGILHGSRPDGYFRNVCVYCPEFPGARSSVTACRDNALQDGQTLAEMLCRSLLEGSAEASSFAWHLFQAYEDFVLSRIGLGAAHLPEVEEVRAQIAAHFTDADFDLPGVIAATRYSADHFRLCFQAQNQGLTPRQYLSRLRLDYADSLLERYGAQMQVQEVATRCGFRDPLYFSRVYKNSRGLSPAQKQQQKGN